jgi:hypothetical protein
VPDERCFHLLRLGRPHRCDFSLTIANDTPIFARNRRYKGDGEAARQARISKAPEDFAFFSPVQIIQGEGQRGFQQHGFVVDRGAGQLQFVEFAVEALDDVQG